LRCRCPAPVYQVHPRSSMSCVRSMRGFSSIPGRSVPAFLDPDNLRSLVYSSETSGDARASIVDIARAQRNIWVCTGIHGQCRAGRDDCMVPETGTELMADPVGAIFQHFMQKSPHHTAISFSLGIFNISPAHKLRGILPQSLR